MKGWADARVTASVTGDSLIHSIRSSLPICSSNTRSSTGLGRNALAPASRHDLESLSETLAKWETPGVTVTKMPVYEAGFTRTNAAR